MHPRIQVFMCNTSSIEVLVNMFVFVLMHMCMSTLKCNFLERINFEASSRFLEVNKCSYIDRWGMVVTCQ